MRREVTRETLEPSDVIVGGFRRRASLREIEPLPLEDVREDLPVSRIRFGFFELAPSDAEAIWALVDRRTSVVGFAAATIGLPWQRRPATRLPAPRFPVGLIVQFLVARDAGLLVGGGV